MAFETLLIESRNNVIYCRLNRPEKRNAINLKMLEELLQVFTEIRERREIRALVLKGSGKLFSAGADLSMMKDTLNKDIRKLKSEAGLFFDCFDSLYSLEVPTICYVHGGVHGGANGLLAACDYALCETDTRFSFAEIRLGLVPSTVAPFIMGRTNAKNAKKLMLGAHVFDAREAIECGLVDIVVPDKDADKNIRIITSRILENAPSATRETKKLLLEIENTTGRMEMKEKCTELIARARLSEEALEGLEAHFNKRNPFWKSDGNK